MQNPPPVQTAPAKSSTGLDENVAALLSYIAGWVSGLIFFLIEKDSRLVRFHAMQSLLLNVLVIVLAVVIWVVTVVLWLISTQISGIISMLVSLIATLVWVALGIGILVAVIMCLIKAYQGQYFKLPIIGNFAEKFSQK
ncbi:MAG TPA: DUF4870 domain-containing protein [Pyrinomonadaceae bacterium]|nr:DUF4870 domain-containing protein [Pyrinomonadaceae bacterium]